ncbi:MAG: hypothetical protein KA509_02125 [Flavobacterium sp.]|nr:hypothetical protein [Flavobacterium sp.]
MKKFNLENVPKTTSGFIVPDNYFEDFSNKVLSQLPDETNRVIPLYKQKSKLLMAVAALLIIGLFIPIFKQLPKPAEELDLTTLENHLSYQTNINQYDLISELDEDDLNKMGATIQLKDDIIEEHLSTNSDLERLLSE